MLVALAHIPVEPVPEPEPEHITRLREARDAIDAALAAWEASR